MADFNKGPKSQATKQSAAPQPDAGAAVGTQATGNSDAFAAAFGTNLLAGESGVKAAGLVTMFNEAAEQPGSGFDGYKMEVLRNPDLPGGEVAIIYFTTGAEAFVNTVFFGDLNIFSRRHTIGGQTYMGQPVQEESLPASVSEILNYKVKGAGDVMVNPYLESVRAHLINSKAIPADGTVILAGSTTVWPGEDANIVHLVGYAQAEIRAYICAKNQFVDPNVDKLINMMKGGLTVRIENGVFAQAGVKGPVVDGLGTPVMAPLVLGVYRHKQEVYAAGNTEEKIGEVRGYIDFIPYNEEARANRAHQNSVAGNPNAPVAHYKPLIAVTGIEWLCRDVAATAEGALALLSVTKKLGEGVSWFDKTINGPTSGATSRLYDIASVGYFLGDKTPAEELKTEEFRTPEAQSSMLAKFWEGISVVLDIPRTGPFKTYYDMLADVHQCNRLLRNLGGVNAPQLSGEHAPVSLREIPVGIYTDEDGRVRDSRDVTNMFSIATKYKGDMTMVNQYLQNWVDPRMGLDDNTVYASRLTDMDRLIENGSFQLRSTSQRVALNDALIAAAAQCLADRQVQVTLHQTKVTQAATGYAGGLFGTGIQQQGGQAGGWTGQSYNNSLL